MAQTVLAAKVYKAPDPKPRWEQTRGTPVILGCGENVGSGQVQDTGLCLLHK